MLKSVGSKELAWNVIRRMFVESKAYREFLIQNCPRLQEPGITSLPKDFTWDEIPTVTKGSFYSQHSFKDLLPESNLSKIYGFTRSSGTTAPQGESSRGAIVNRGFFWPSLREPINELSDGFANMIKLMTSGPKQQTLFIVGLSLGSWAGGENIGLVSKLTSLSQSFPLTVFSPGNQHDEIVEMIDFGRNHFDRIIVACCPSAIYYLLKNAESSGIKLPMEKLGFMVTGEPFAEELRQELQRLAGPERRTPMIHSVYGSADAGFTGMESNHLIALRQEVLRIPALADRLDLLPGSVPTFFHLQAKNQFFEIVDGELVVTGWQGLPLARYNLEDRVQLFSWDEICAAMIAEAQDERQAKVWRYLLNHGGTDVAAVYGRSKGCLFLCGSNIFDSMLEEVLLDSKLLDDKITGHFVVWVNESNAQQQQQLHWQIEVTDPEVANDPAFVDKLYTEFCDSLGRLQPEFMEDFNRFYSKATTHADRIFRFHFSVPGMIQRHPGYHAGIKRRIIQTRGPLISKTILAM